MEGKSKWIPAFAGMTGKIRDTGIDVTPIRTAVEDMPLAARLLEGMRYPLQGRALAACIVLALLHYAVVLPAGIGILGGFLVWTATWRYAIDCMVHTAGGHAEAPAMSANYHSGNPRGILVLHVAVIVACMAVAAFAPAALWLALAVAALLLPAIDMSLAFDGDVLVALNPATWVEVVSRFGTVYLVPVIANAALALLIWRAAEGATRLPFLVALPAFGFIATYLVVLDFHWMGVLVWHHRRRLGMDPQEQAGGEPSNPDSDAALIAECTALAESDPEAAAIRLRDRIHDHYAPPEVHTLFRGLLRTLQRRDLLLSHGQTWIAQLCATGDARRALGVVQECRGIDPGFVPDDPEHAIELTRLAARIGMRDLADHLARTFAQRWPRHEAIALIARETTGKSLST